MWNPSTVSRSLTTLSICFRPKCESVLKLVEANRVGDVRGHYAAVDRMVRNFDSTGVLTATDWDSIAPLLTDLEVVIERLRAHVHGRLVGRLV
jgi:hypothetical protein